MPTFLHQGLEEPPSPAGVVEHEGARRIELAHGEVPEVSGLAVGVGEGPRDHGHPALEERPQVGGTEAVADALERCRVLTRDEAVGLLVSIQQILAG
jgi:hypothetical protein